MDRLENSLGDTLDVWTQKSLEFSSKVDVTARNLLDNVKSKPWAQKVMTKFGKKKDHQPDLVEEEEKKEAEPSVIQEAKNDNPLMEE